MVYFMMLSIARLKGFEYENDRFIGKDLAENNCRPIEWLRRYFSVRTEEILEKNLGIAGATVEIQTQHFPDRSLSVLLLLRPTRAVTHQNSENIQIICFWQNGNHYNFELSSMGTLD
jgi:hypothetical protein